MSPCLSPLRIVSPLLAAAGIVAAAPVAAADFANLPQIDRAVADFTGAPIGAVGGAATPIDRRLRLAGCTAPLGLSWRGYGRDIVVVQCPDAGGWRLFVPVRSGAGQGGSGTSAGAAAVSRGEEVTVTITGDGFTVSQSGEALEAGAVGEWIRVVPVKDSKGASEPIRAQIVRPGLVAVLLP